ncbi:MAG: hypothetical protein ABMA25_15960 [Ilumatobacteraceae bacterium]
MTNRSMYKVGVVLLAAGLFGACSSSNPTSGGAAAPADAPAATGSDAGTPADPGSAPSADDLCTTIPDFATIEAAIGIPVKDPLGVGAAGFQQSCTLLRGTDDFPGITFTYTPGATIAGQIEFAKTNFNIDIVPLEEADGFYAGEGDSAYWEGNGALYQTSAVIDGDSRGASLRMLQAWLGM